MINFKNQEELLNYLSNNSKHYTPESIIKIIGLQIKDIDFTDKSILETSVGEAHLLAGLIEMNPTIKNAKITIHDLEDYNINIAKSRLELLGCKNIETHIGDFMEFNHEDQYIYDFCFQNPPYGTKIEFTINDYWKEKIGLKKNINKSPESAFLYKVSQLAKHSFSILPVGVLFRSGWENKVIEKTIDMWRRVTLFSGNLFTTTSIPVVLVELNYNNHENLRMSDITDLSSKSGKIRTMTDEQIEEAFKVINGGYETHISKLLTMEEIKQNKYNLNVTRYIQRIQEEQIDMDELSKDIDDSLTQLMNMFVGVDPNAKKYEDVNIFQSMTKQIKEDLS